MIQLTIIADDLTGALEAGSQMAEMSIPSMVVSGKSGLRIDNLSLKKCSVLIVNSESRHLSPRAAGSRVTTLVKSIQGMASSAFYKKTDSTLRGNIGPELYALMKATRRKTLAFIPAHPKLGRYTRNGWQFLGKKKLHQTVFAQDPLEPVHTGYLPEVLSLGRKVELSLIGNERLKNKNPIPGSRGIWVFDCTSEEELRVISGFLSSMKPLPLMAGTAGFVKFLPELFSLTPSFAKKQRIIGPALILNGSLNPITLSQVKFAKAMGIRTISIFREISKDPKAKIKSRTYNRIVSMNRSLKPGQNLLLTSAPLGSKTQIPGTEALRRDQLKKRYQSAANGIARIVVPLLSSSGFRSLVVIGGDTLSAVLNEMKCYNIIPAGEMKPGVAASRIRAGNKELSLITKPGGYGDKREIYEIVKRINVQADDRHHHRRS